MNKLIFKRIDFWLQIGFILIFFCYIFLYFTKFIEINLALNLYFILAIWQILSAILNFLYRFNSTNRITYNQILSYILVYTVIALFCLVTNFIPQIFLFSMFIFITSPILAIWYLIITWTELAEMEKTELKK